MIFDIYGTKRTVRSGEVSVSRGYAVYVYQILTQLYNLCQSYSQWIIFHKLTH